MNALDHLFVFSVDTQAFALPLTAVERVVRAVEITPLPRMPQILLGVINLQGNIIPVIDLRRLLRVATAEAPAIELELSDYLIIVRGARRTMALPAHAVSGVLRCADAAVTATEVLPPMQCLEGVIKMGDAIVAVCDPDRLLSFVEERSLEEAMPVGEALEAGSP